MASGLVQTTGRHGPADPIVAHVAAQGSAAHAYRESLALSRGAAVSRNLADVVHFYSLLHGGHPGILDLVTPDHDHAAASSWLETARSGFSAERGYLARLVVAVGPLPSTPGQAESEAALFAQRHALETLARSERRGCALGAGVALVLDWSAIRSVLDLAGDRFGVGADPLRLPSPASTAEFVDAFAVTVPVERALAFGAQQLLLQHRGLWSLLEAREAARRDIA